MKLKQLLMTADPAKMLRAMRSSGELNNFDARLAALDMEIPKGYHHKDVLEHSIRVLENAIALEPNDPDLILRTAALYHDIGKPDTREFKSNGVVTFQMHENVGANLVKKILYKHGYNKNEVQSVSNLVRLHMRSHSFKSGWSDSAVRRLAKDAGSDRQLERLIVIFRSDATTKHAHKRKAIDANVEGLQLEFSRILAKDARKSKRPSLNGNEVSQLLGISPGPKLGKVMKALNEDGNVDLDRESSIRFVKNFKFE